ncbi:hypothetical protein DFH94DRAFT_159408 [Russula ochroleuca]|uniref:Uncharacterized protein n=1 Tax=Russula ochroleuca TaxID=152965 RepID=A0A9P5TDH6_9AGAM|nr:hypothetical protein DFH94DRAFT_159408 [Russula ochroleuca]
MCTTTKSTRTAHGGPRIYLIDTIVCGLEGLRFLNCLNPLRPVLEGTIDSNGTNATRSKQPSRPNPKSVQRSTFGTIIRWPFFNDCFLAEECTCLPSPSPSSYGNENNTVVVVVPGGHPSDTLGTILAVAGHLSHQGERVTVLECMIKAQAAAGCRTRPKVASRSSTCSSALGAPVNPWTVDHPSCIVSRGHAIWVVSLPPLLVRLTGRWGEGGP